MKLATLYSTAGLRSTTPTGNIPEAPESGTPCAIMDKMLGPNGVRYRGVPLYSCSSLHAHFHCKYFASTSVMSVVTLQFRKLRTQVPVDALCTKLLCWVLGYHVSPSDKQYANSAVPLFIHLPVVTYV